MSQENQITLRGYLTAEPRLHQKTPQSVPVTEIRVGSTPRRLNHETGEWYDLPTSYYRVKAWRRLAINVVGSLHKGDQVFVRGRFYMNAWIDNQQRPRATLEIDADTIGHDLAFGWSHFMRGLPPGKGGAGNGDGETPDETPGEALSAGDAQQSPDAAAGQPTDGEDPVLAPAPSASDTPIDIEAAAEEMVAAPF